MTAALADSETARTAWRKWRDENDLARADHAEVRLLAAVAGRIRKIEGDMPLDPRLEGMRRHIWAMNQMTLGATKPLLAAMSAAGLPLMPLKGAARLAIDPDVSKERALRDVDVLVPPDEWARAVGVVLAAGWRNSRGENAELLQSAAHA
ncbi:MAG TPA: nucleotidyltransferase family protein, partial [Dongiaceae bacterium]|nr:nucleotidyltransferase family protein [Dongiaceae bacterium]